MVTTCDINYYYNIYFYLFIFFLINTTLRFEFFLSLTIIFKYTSIKSIFKKKEPWNISLKHSLMLSNKSHCFKINCNESIFEEKKKRISKHPSASRINIEEEEEKENVSFRRENYQFALPNYESCLDAVKEIKQTHHERRLSRRSREGRNREFFSRQGKRFSFTG